jgi:hypothetical protein
MSDGSISGTSPLPKYYWIQYSLLEGIITDTCTTEHPFHFIHNKNQDSLTKLWSKIRLVNWKEISKEDFFIWLAINPATESENKNQIYDVKEMD